MASLEVQGGERSTESKGRPEKQSPANCLSHGSLASLTSSLARPHLEHMRETKRSLAFFPRVLPDFGYFSRLVLSLSFQHWPLRLYSPLYAPHPPHRPLVVFRTYSSHSFSLFSAPAPLRYRSAVCTSVSPTLWSHVLACALSFTMGRTHRASESSSSFWWPT